MAGKSLEHRGWLQGCIIESDFIPTIVNNPTTQCIGIEPNSLITEQCILIVASQSCDIANSELNTVQLLVARNIENRHPQKTYNGHPRILDTHITEVICLEDKTEKYDTIERSIQIKILEKIFVRKALLLDVGFNKNITWGPQEAKSYRNWLGEHYTRPAFPTSFNNLLKSKNKIEDKLTKIAKQANQHLYAIYAKLYPFRELKEAEKYKIQLLGALTNDGHEATAQEQINRYKQLLEQVGIEVTVAIVLPKKQISMAMLEGMERFHLDKLSYRDENAKLPADVEPGL